MADIRKISDSSGCSVLDEPIGVHKRGISPDIQTQYRTLFAAMSEGVLLQGSDGQILDINPAAERILGCTADTVLSGNRAFPWSVRRTDGSPLPAQQQPWFVTFQTGFPQSNVEMGILRDDDKLVWIAVNTQPLFDAGESACQRVMTIFQDITHKLRPEESLWLDDARIQPLFEAIANPFFVKDSNGRYRACNSAFESYLGLRRDQIIGHTVYDISPKELADRYCAADQALFDDPGTQVYETQVRWADGSLHDVIFHKTTLTGADGSVRGLTGTIVDITERKLMEQALRHREQQYRTLVEHSPDLIVRYDVELRRIYVNPAWERASGLSADEATNVPAMDVTRVTQPVVAEYLAALRQTLESGTSQAVEFSWVNARGETLQLQYRVVPECDQDGRVMSLLSVGHDVTAFKRTEDALRDSESHLRRVNRALRTLSAGNETLVRADSEKALLEQMCRVMVEVGGHVLASIGEVAADGISVEPRAWAGSADTSLRKCACDRACHALAEKLEHGVPWVLHDLASDSRCGECGERFRSCGVRSGMILRLCNEGETLGLLSIYSNDLAAFDADEVVLLSELGNDLAYGIRALRDRLDREEGLQRIQLTMEAAIQALASTVEFRDPYTAGHQRRVGQLAMAIGHELGLSDDRVNGLYLASVVHDIGKISVPVEVLTRPGRLSKLEYDIVKTHVDAGYDILKSIDFPWPIAVIVRQHHERMDGSGYPAGMGGDELLLESRILAVADTVEAVASFRPYRPALGVDRALAEIENGRGILFDSDVVDICTRLFREHNFTFE